MLNLAEKRMFYQPNTHLWNQLYGLNDLCEQYAKGVACEIGSFAGVSSNLIASYVEELHCIDAWKPHPEIPEQYIIEAEKRFDLIAENNSNIKKQKGDSLEILSQYPDVKIGMDLEDLHRMDINTKMVLIRDLQFGLGIYSE